MILIIIEVAIGMYILNRPLPNCRSPGRRPRGSLSESKNTTPIKRITVPAIIKNLPTSTQFINTPFNGQFYCHFNAHYHQACQKGSVVKIDFLEEVN